MKKYGLYEFRQDFPNKKAAIDYVMKRRKYEGDKLYKMKGGNSFVNARGRHYNPLWGTVFFDSHIELHRWFYGIYLVYTDQKWTGRSFAKEMGIAYRIAWKYLNIFKSKVDRSKTFKQNINIFIDDTTSDQRRKPKRIK